MKIKEILKQWSTLRGMLLMIATLAGLNPLVVGAASQVIDLLPAVVTGVIAVYEIARDDKKPAKVVNNANKPKYRR